MSNNTIYPYGTGGQIPSGIAIVNDLTTGGADKALAAQQGVVLKGTIDGLSDITERNYVNGRYIKNNGAADIDYTKFHSKKIPAVKGDVIYWRYGSSESMYMCEYDSSGAKLNEWIASSNTARTITLTKDNTAYIIASFNGNYFNNAYITKNGTVVYKPTDGEYGEIAELFGCRDAVFAGGSFLNPIPYTINRSGVYMNTSGEDVSNANYGITDPIFVPKGTTIYGEFYCGTLGAAIAVTDSAGNFISLGKVGVGVDIKEYSLKAEDDMYVTICAAFGISHAFVAFLYDASSLSGGGDEEVIWQGNISGNGNTIVSQTFPARRGDYLRIRFPNGNWQTTQERESYNKLLLGSVVNKQGSAIGSREVMREGWVAQDYGYDFIVDAFNTIDTPNDTLSCIHIRATSGSQVPCIISRLSKTTPKVYFQDELAKTVASVKNMFVDGKCLVFAICSDLHYLDLEENYRPFAPYSPLQMAITMRAFTERVRTDNVVCLGDVSDGRWSANAAKVDARVCQWFLAQCKAPVLNSVGNHDDNRYYNQQGGDRRLTQAEIYSNMIAYCDERVSVDGAMGGCNYYRDIERAKVRLITLMPIDFNGQYNYTSDTQTWLTNTFNSMESGWKAILFTHVPPINEHNWSGSGYTGGTAIANIITANRDKVLFLYEGHTHIDNVYVAPWPAINIGCQKVYNSTDGLNNLGSSAPEDAWWPVRAVGDYREVLWDAVVVDQTNSLLSCIRFGAGVDRYIHLAPVSCSAGGTVTLTPSVITATTWHAKTSESESVSVDSSGVVTVESGVTSGTQLTIRAADADGNFEYWAIKVS